MDFHSGLNTTTFRSRKRTSPCSKTLQDTCSDNPSRVLTQQMYTMYLLVPTTLVLMLGAVAGNRRSLEPECYSQFDYNHKLLYKLIKVEEDVKKCHIIMEEVEKLKEELKEEHKAKLAATEDVIKTLKATADAVIDDLKKHNREQETEQKAKLSAELDKFTKASEDTMRSIKEDTEKLKTDTDEAIISFQATTKKLISKSAVGFTVKYIKALPSVSNHATFITVVTNKGDGYDTATGLFTCPEQGTYYFSASLLKQHSYTSSTYCKIYKNNDELVMAYTKPGRSGYTAAVNSAYVHLEVGDTVKLAGCGSLSKLHQYSSFSGFLVTPDND